MSTNGFKILVLDDDPAMKKVLSLRMKEWGYHAVLAATVEEADTLVRQEAPDLVLTDLVLVGESGLDLLGRMQLQDGEVPVVVMTAHGDVAAAVDAMKQGARDFLTKPLDYSSLHALLETEAAELRHRGRVRDLEDRLRGSEGSSLVGDGRRMREVQRLVKLIAASDAAALITGESGTGKEVIARTIHKLSDRRNGPFVALNAAAIPEGLMESELFGHEEGAFTGASGLRKGCFELAEGGTLLLDEIAEMPMALQPKLLRILEERRGRRLGGSEEIAYDIRVLAATNRSPESAIQGGRLREDLLYRLNVFELRSPPLREHPEDIPLLAHHFIREFNERHGTRVQGVGRSALELLQLHSWRGNVRELRNVMERAVILAGSGWVDAPDLPTQIRKLRSGSWTIVLPTGVSLAEAERKVILETLDRVGHNKAEAARQLGIDVKTVRNKLKAYEGSEEP